MGERWVRPAACIVALELLVAFLVGMAAGHRTWPPVFGYALTFSQLLLLIAAIAVFVIAIPLRGVDHPSRVLYAKLHANRDVIAPLAIGMALVMMSLVALTWAKPTVPMFGGFWADQPLADAEAALLGTDAWRITHAMIGSRSFVIDWVYALWFPVLLASLFLVFISRNPVKSRLIVVYFLTVIIGVLIQFALPSAGPIFWGRLGFGDRFAELIPLIPTQAMKGADFLWACHIGYGDCTAGMGISAWPSMHVALASWAVLAAAKLKRRLVSFAAAWWALILFGSVYLGWHYVLDGVAGALIVPLAWAISSRTSPQASSELSLAQ